jgi:Cu/Ag efflux pump CusA
MAFTAMRALGIGANIMSLGGIAIAIGAMIDAAIVMIENAHKHLERAEPGKPRVEVLIEAASEVGPALFFSLLIITVSFLPIFALEGQEGRLFGPLAATKTFAMAAAALLSVTLVPALMVIFVRGRIVPEHRNPVNRVLIALYRPVIQWVLRARVFTITLALVALVATIWPARQLGSEFMPALDEGTMMYMPTTLPGLSVTKAAELMQMQDRIIRSFPEVETVFGKAGRALTATDPAPTEMFETIIQLKPKDEWREGVTMESLRLEMDAALQFPGVSNAWTQPIRARIDMLATGIRTPVGVKGVRHRPDRNGGRRAAGRGGVAQCSRHHQRLCRTGDRRLLPRHRARPRTAGALRPVDPGRAGGDRHGAWGRGDHPDRRGARALQRGTALSRSAATGSRRHRARGSGRASGWWHCPLGRGRRCRAYTGCDVDPH